MLTSLFNDFMKAVGASQRVFELLDRIPEIPFDGGEEEVATIKGSVELQQVSFRYPTRPEEPVLNNINMTIQHGQTAALVGPSGGGKSTVVSLLKRFYDPMEGVVTIDGIDLRSLSRRSYMRHVASVMQEPVLFATSIRENITYGIRAWGNPADEISGAQFDEKVKNAAISANAWEFISKFEQGLDTAVGEKGVRLSGGQKQRIAIARALMKDPKLLLLDEATSALDAESEGLVQAAIDKLLQEHCRTTIVIAHRLSTIRGADNIFVIDNGKLVQEGQHSALLQETEGLYATLISRQMHSI
mmetsp:Transcript_4237/g.6692  ORF Transcript_4237/g.6692 Transcript_4237/m.6692 type:complete len:301 (+) Transcript_4237:44-946(+)